MYDNITSFEHGWKIVADNYGIYPDRMGNAAYMEFGIGNQDLLKENTYE